MLKVLRERLHQGHRTIDMLGRVPVLAPRHRGRPRIDSSKCNGGCEACVVSCPQEAVSSGAGGITLDLGRCIFCGLCVSSCPTGAITLTNDHRLAGGTLESLMCSGKPFGFAAVLDESRRSLFARSLKLRQVSAGGCNACEAEINALSNVIFDMGRFGVQIVASPRHADGVIVTGPVSNNMRQALDDTYRATPSPRVVIACGSCAISGGPFRDSPEVCNGTAKILPVDLFIPGCPPHPMTILDGLLRLTGRIESVT